MNHDNKKKEGTYPSHTLELRKEYSLHLHYKYL